MGIAVAVVAAIWTVIIVALAVWFFMARARNRRADSAEYRFDPPRDPHLDDLGQDETQPVQPLAPAQQGGLPGIAAASLPGLPAVRTPGSAAGAEQGSPAPTAPAGRPPAQPEVRTPPARRNEHNDEPFGLTTQEEYERLAAESFQAPPGAALGESSSRAPFSWSDAADSDLAPTPAATVRRPTGITADPAPPPAPAPAEPDDELDRTVMVPPRTRFDWSLVLPDGARLALEADIVVGRRPGAVEDSALLQIPDPTRTLSKSHARLRMRDERWWVTDLGSTNGLWLLHADGREEALPPHREVEATPRMRFGTLNVELQRGAA